MKLGSIGTYRVYRDMKGYTRMFRDLKARIGMLKDS